MKSIYGKCVKMTLREDRTVFEYIPNRLDEHALRREYISLKYEKIVNYKIEKSKEVKDDYHTRDGSHRSFDREVLEEVSENLGNSRINVVVKHYLE